MWLNNKSQNNWLTWFGPQQEEVSSFWNCCSRNTVDSAEFLVIPNDQCAEPNLSQVSDSGVHHFKSHGNEILRIPQHSALRSKTLETKLQLVAAPSESVFLGNTPSTCLTSSNFETNTSFPTYRESISDNEEIDLLNLTKSTACSVSENEEFTSSKRCDLHVPEKKTNRIKQSRTTSEIVSLFDSKRCNPRISGSSCDPEALLVKTKQSTDPAYTGQQKKNKKHGWGRQTWPDGASYEGQWKNKVAHGMGKFTHSDGYTYIGQWKNDTAYGYGVFRNPEGFVMYQGEWKDDVQHGIGIEYNLDNSIYTGEFKNGRKNGLGLYEFKDGSLFIGEWCDDNYHGFGELVSIDHRSYTGQWSHGLMHGLGQYCWADGNSYEGQYKLDTKDGLGIFKWKDGFRYEGNWYRGFQHGIGRIYKPINDAESYQVIVYRYGKRVYSDNVAHIV